jgi:hypothetical protein
VQDACYGDPVPLKRRHTFHTDQTMVLITGDGKEDSSSKSYYPAGLYTVSVYALTRRMFFKYRNST